jgi:peptide/nickel transport system substrate-binding protein
MCLLVTACSGGDDDSNGGSATGGEHCDGPVPGTEITYGVWDRNASLDPPYSLGGLLGGTELASIYDVLFIYDENEGELTPKLAESITPNDDFTVWTLKLRDGIEYSDGTKLTSRLVSDGMDRFFGDRVRNQAGGYMTSITDKKALDDLTLEIDLDKPWPNFPLIFADEPGMVVNLNAIGDDPEEFGEKPPDEAGLGPYVVEHNAVGEEIVLKARDDYWDGPVCIETLRFVFVPETQPTYEAWQAGDMNVAFLRYQPTIEQAKEAGDPHYFIHQDSGVMFLLNHRQGRPASDPRVREALYLALDDDGVNERSYQGKLSVAKAIVQPGSRFWSDDIEVVPDDKQRAKELVEEARADGWDGKISMTCGNPADEAMSAEGMWDAVGIDAEVAYKAVAEQLRTVVEGDYDSACWGFNIGPGTGPLSMIRNFRSDSSSNRTGYANPDMDIALDHLQAAATKEEQQAAVAEVDKIFVQDHVVIAYGGMEEGIVWKPDIHGIVPTLSSIFLFDNAYIEE